MFDWTVACVAAGYSFNHEREFLKESYDGDGVWSVWIDTTSDGASPLLWEIMEDWTSPEGVMSSVDFKWRVYESTGTVFSEGILITPDGELESRPYC